MPDYVDETQRAGRETWSSQYQFEPSGGGLGIVMSATTTSGTSSRTALVGTGRVARIAVDGGATVCLALGDSSVTATTSFIRFGPGVEFITIPVADSDPPRPTHAAVITAAGTATVNITLGEGG